MAKKLDANSLNVKKTPMINRKKIGKKIGKKWGLGITHFTAFLFKTNEVRARSQKMTDAEIARQIAVEYAHVDGMAEKYDPRRNPELQNLISKLRSEYNRGRLVTADPPPERKFISFSYDENGDPVNLRFIVPKVLSFKEAEKKRDDFYEKYRKPYEDSLKKAKAKKK